MNWLNRFDVAQLLTRMLFEPEASGLTFETIALPGYAIPRDFGLQVSFNEAYFRSFRYMAFFFTLFSLAHNFVFSLTQLCFLSHTRGPL